MSLYPQILGVYSRQGKADVGAGATHGSYDQVTYWFARRLDDDLYEIQPLNANHVPSGVKYDKTKQEFHLEFQPEPTYFERHTQPALKSLQRKIAEGEESFAAGDLDKAEKEFLKALMIDELNVPANLGVGAVYSEKQEFQKVHKVCKILMGSDETFEAEQRARFNTMGMSMRKQGMLDDALELYLKALEHDDGDENLHFNLARVYFDKGDRKGTIKHLKQCLELNPDLEVAKKFVRYCKKHFK